MKNQSRLKIDYHITKKAIKASLNCIKNTEFTNYIHILTIFILKPNLKKHLNFLENYIRSLPI